MACASSPVVSCEAAIGSIEPGTDCTSSLVASSETAVGSTAPARVSAPPLTMVSAAVEPASAAEPSSPRLAASPAAPANPAVNPLIRPRFRSPVTAAVPTPLRTPVISGLSLSRLPNPPKSKGRNASGWPVTGLVVSCPVGDSDAIPATSTGFICTSMESP